VQASVRVNVYSLLEDKMDGAIDYGYMKAYKHVEDGKHPTEEHLKLEMHRSIMNTLAEFFKFNEEN
jgi:hypothetical protein